MTSGTPPESKGSAVQKADVIPASRPQSPASVDAWLAWLERGQGGRIELGLERVHRVAERLGITSDRLKARPRPLRIATIAGTNGKGTVVHAVDAILRATTDLRVGRYTSPHLFDFRERIVIDGRPLPDRDLVEAFARVAAAAGLEGPMTGQRHLRSEGGQASEWRASPIALTYFEFTTLAMMVGFVRADVDVAILEVGLGGRLDAVNVWDADVTAVTSIARDHEAFLGSSLDGIAREKAGIARAGVPCWVGSLDSPQALIETLTGRGAQVRTAASFGWSAAGAVEVRSSGTANGPTTASVHGSGLDPDPVASQDASALTRTWWWRPDGTHGLVDAAVAAAIETPERSAVEVAVAVSEHDATGAETDRNPRLEALFEGARGRNLAVAIGVAHDLLKAVDIGQDGSSGTRLRTVSTAALMARPPGRFEVREVTLPDAGLDTAWRRRRVIFDVAHNPAAVGELIAMLARDGAGPSAPWPSDVVFGAMADKDIPEMLRLCAAQPGLACARWWLGAPDQARAAPVARLMEEARLAGLERRHALPTLALWPASVMRPMPTTSTDSGSLLDVSERRPLVGPVLVFGSFFTVAEAQAALDAYLKDDGGKRGVPRIGPDSGTPIGSHVGTHVGAGVRPAH